MPQDRNILEPPLTARSVIASTLLGTTPPVLPSRVLVRAGELFGIAEGTIRVALSRMVSAGELIPEDGRYRLAGHLLDRQARQEASRHPRLARWTGAWRIALVAADRRSAADRAGLRRAMRSLRLSELREGVWMRPANLHLDVAGVAAEHCVWVTGEPDEDGAALAALLWDLEGWAIRAEELRAGMAAQLPALRSGDAAALAPGFVLSAAVLRHFQADPLLPDPLLPAGWPGAALRRDYDRYDSAYRRLLRRWFAASTTP